ncbi:MAG: TonB-dependent receptor [Bacteroidota bacterium]
MTRTLWFFLSILFLPYLGLAQTASLSGRIIDAETREPLAGASIFIIGTYKGAFSQEDGRYTIEGIKPGDYSIRFSYIGYAEKIFNGIRLGGGKNELNSSLNSSVQTLGEVEIVGQRTLINLESGQSQVLITEDEINEMGVKNVQEIVAMQVGVNETPDGVQIRGGRVYETEYLIDGINAQDPLAGTGFGVDVNALAVKDVELITGGSGVEFGSGTSGVVLTRIKEGGEKFSVNLDYQRDNLGFNKNQGPSWNTDQMDVSVSGPIIKDKLSFFVGGSAFLTDTYFRVTADQLRSSILDDETSWAPRQDNRWSNTLKLAYNVKPGWKITLTNQHSLNINQNTRSLQVIGNDAVVTPGFQYRFSLDMDQANTYTHRSNLSVLSLRGVLGEQWTMELSGGRLFTNLRADANGRPFRTETVDQILDPASIVTDPVDVFNPLDDVVYVFPGPGLTNNGGIATLWHDHYVQEYTFKGKFSYQSKSKVHYLNFGLEHKEQNYQWIDVSRPWVGAPIRINDTLTTPSNQLGQSSDVWNVSPATGGLFFQDEIRYKGIIAVLGARLNYWAPGKFVDEQVESQNALILDVTRENYLNETTKLFGRRWKARLLPRINVSFPVSDNNVLYFNYSHSMRLPHPRMVYQGLAPEFRDNSFLADLGNPNLNPEVTVSYEIGLKSQLTRDLALTMVAFYNDKFDYIIRRRIEVPDPIGIIVARSFFINQDYARIRGIEVALTKRIGKSFMGTVSGSYSVATGKSNSAAESGLQIVQQGFVNTTEEQFLAWDRPFDLKLLALFTPDSSVYIGGFPLKGFRLSVSSTWKSGLRYTPFTLARVNDFTGRPEYERLDDRPFDEVGTYWFWTDASLSRDFTLGPATLSLSVAVTNLTNYRSAAIVNGVTGDAYEFGDPLPLEVRDPLFPDPQNNGIPPFNPARFTAPRQVLFGVQLQF